MASRVLPSFQISTASGEFESGLVNPCDWLILWNETPATLVLEFSDGSTNLAPAWTAKSFQVGQPSQRVIWRVLDTLTSANAPIGRVTPIAYSSATPPTGTYPIALPRLTNIGNQIDATISGQVVTTDVQQGAGGFPANPIDNQRFYRNDWLESWIYNGIYGYWYQAEPRFVSWARFDVLQPYTATPVLCYSGGFQRLPSLVNFNAILIDSIELKTYSANIASQATTFWTVTAQCIEPGVKQQVIGSRSTQNSATLTWIAHPYISGNFFPTNPSNTQLEISVTKNTAHAGHIYVMAIAQYRYAIVG